jgi:hypothetical protein
MKAFQRFKKKLGRIKSWILNYKVRIILILLLYPNIVCYTPDSTGTSSTVIDFLLGVGKYAIVTYNCEGQATSVTKYSFFDYGGSVSHNIDEFKFGVRGGGYSVNNLGSENTSSNYYGDYDSYTTDDNSTQYINPFIGFENKYFDLNFGAVFLSGRNYYGNIDEYFINDGTVQPSWFMRIGNKEKFHFSTQYLSNVPLISGGGMADAGFGFGSTETRNLTWVGLSFGPFQNLGFSVKQNIQVTDNLDILIRGRIGTIESNFEGGISAGVRFNI